MSKQSIHTISETPLTNIKLTLSPRHHSLSTIAQQQHPKDPGTAADTIEESKEEGSTETTLGSCRMPIWLCKHVDGS